MLVSMVVPVGCTVNTSCVAAPAVPVALNVTGLPPPENPVAVAVSVLAPAVVPSFQLVIVAIPLALVVAGFVPLNEPLPTPMAKVTVTPATGLPFASVTRTAGAVATLVFTVAD